jgi:hypothetical protein
MRRRKENGMADEGNEWKASNLGDVKGDGTVRSYKQKQDR